MKDSNSLSKKLTFLILLIAFILIGAGTLINKSLVFTKVVEHDHGGPIRSPSSPGSEPSPLEPTLSFESNPDNNKVQIEIANKIISLLEGRIKQLTKEILVFNYSNSTLQNQSSEQVKQRATNVANRFWWEPNPESKTALADGLYLAVDPLVSRSFAGDHFALMTIKLPTGFRYLEVDYTWNPEEQSIVTQLEEFGCMEATQHGVLLGKSYECREFSLYILKKLRDVHGVRAVLYPWNAALFPQCPQRNIDNAKAFIFLMTNDLEANRFDLLRKDNSDGILKTQNAKFIESLMRRPAGSFDVMGAEYGSLWPNLQTPSNEDTLTWVKQNLFNCQD